MGLDMYMSSSSGTGASPQGDKALPFPLDGGLLLGVDGGKGG